jgi:hypothetical protein
MSKSFILLKKALLTVSADFSRVPATTRVSLQHRQIRTVSGPGTLTAQSLNTLPGRTVGITAALPRR